ENGEGRSAQVPARKKQASASGAASSRKKTTAVRKDAPVRKPRPAATDGEPRGKHDLVIVESPTKAKTINKYLGSAYRVLASYGHVRDLPKRRRKGEVVAGINIDGWIPTYVVQDREEGKVRGRRTPKEILA